MTEVVDAGGYELLVRAKAIIERRMQVIEADPVGLPSRELVDMTRSVTDLSQQLRLYEEREQKRIAKLDFEGMRKVIAKHFATWPPEQQAAFLAELQAAQTTLRGAVAMGG